MTLDVIDRAAYDHLVRVRVEEELRQARKDQEWYEAHPADQIVFGGEFYHEHRGRLALLERLVKP